MRPLAALTLLVVPVIALPQTGRPRELLTNGGFEEGFEGWQPDSKHELVVDAKVAHGGERCVTGEVTQPNTHLTISRTFDLRAGALYTISLWARGTNRTKLVVWRSNAAGQRVMVAAFENQVPQWRQYESTFSVETSGSWKIELISPSSHGAPAGRLWIDDVQLSALDVPEPVDVSQGQGFNDWPRMAPMGDALCCAWISFRDGADSLQAASLPRAGGPPSQTWEIAGGKGTYILDPYVVPDGESAWVLYATEVSGDWEIMAAKVTASGAGTPIRLTSRPGVDVKPKGAVLKGALCVVWEASVEGRRQIMAAWLKQGKGGKPQVISDRAAQNYEPCAAGAEGGPLTVAWTAWEQGNADIAVATFEGGKWSKPRKLTTAPTLDRHVTLCPAGQELWMAWENASSTGYHIGASQSRRIAVAKLTPQGLQSPVCLKASPLWEWAESAEPAVDEVGRLWVAYLKPRNKNDGWDVYLHCLTGSECSPAYRVASSKGMDRPLSLVPDGKRMLVGFQADSIPRGWQNVEAASTDETWSRACLAALDISGAPSPLPVETEAYVEPDEAYEAADLRVARGEDLPTRSITYEGRKLRLYYGDLHEHTDVSVCNRSGDQSIDESYQSMRDIARHDFACATDHGYNLNPYLWHYTAKLARANEDLGRFLTFLAEEWTSSFEEYSEKYPQGFYGHRNLILEDAYWPSWYNSRNRERPTELWKRLDAAGASYVHIPHQLADTGNVPVDWDEVDERSQPVAEIFQTRGSYEYDGAPRQAKNTLKGNFIQDAWAKGVVIGIIASPDHGGGMGKAAVYAPELSRKAILDAIRQRHTYGTTAAKILLDVRVEGRLMGEKVARASAGPVTVEVDVTCPQDIKRIDICRSNEFIYTQEPGGKTARFSFQDTDPLAAPSYYYVRVIQTDDEIAWSSPVWVQPG
jgi:hypothetical protein